MLWPRGIVSPRGPPVVLAPALALRASASVAVDGIPDSYRTELATPVGILAAVAKGVESGELRALYSTARYG
jgi:hypothetical protein